MSGPGRAADVPLLSMKTFSFFFSQVAGELVKGKPTYVAIGDLVGLLYADEIGLSADL